MNSKKLNFEEGKIKMDNIKNLNINLSEIINKKKKFKGFREGRELHIFNQISKNQNNKLNDFHKNQIINKCDNAVTNRISTKEINKNAKIAKLSLELYPDKPYKISDNLIKNKYRKRIHHSNRKFYPKKYIKMIFHLTETNNKNKKKKRTHSFNRNKKEQRYLFKKIFDQKIGSVYDGGIPLMTFEKSKRKKFMNNTLREKKLINNNEINSKQNISYNQHGNCINNNIVSKPQCLYKGPAKYDLSVGEEDTSPQNNQSLFRTFMSRNLKPTKPEANNQFMEYMENSNKESQACTFIRYNANGTMKTKRIFNSTFHINDNSNSDINKEINTTVINNMGIDGNNNKKKRTFGGIMLSGKNKLF